MKLFSVLIILIIAITIQLINSNVCARGFMDYPVNTNGTISGDIRIDFTNIGYHDHDSTQRFELRIQCIELKVNSKHEPIIPSVDNFYRVSKSQLKKSISKWIDPQKNGLNLVVQDYQFDDLELNKYYIIFGFILEIDTKSENSFHHSKENADSLEFYRGMIGWYAGEKGPFCSWFSPIFLSQTALHKIDFSIAGITPFDYQSRDGLQILKHIKGFNVLQLKGTPKERGYAHGFAIGPQIIDFFRYYILPIVGCSDYEQKVVPSLKNSTLFYFSSDFLDEANAMIQGMKNSATINMYVKELRRDFNVTEIMAINGYAELTLISNIDESGKSKLTESKTECSQFSLWSSLTKDLGGSILSGRNMDGEIDLRKVTVSHFMVFAVTPYSHLNHFNINSQKRYVSFMWPGFIGTFSGVNEDGFYVMENAGSSHPVVHYHNSSFATVIIQSLLKDMPGKGATPEYVSQYLRFQYGLKSGGVCTRGCVLFMATPPSKYSKSEDVSFVYEGDYKGGYMRLPQQAEPFEIQDLIQATNHFHIYGVDPDVGPHVNFGQDVYFSSLWRYESSMQFMRAYHNIGSTEPSMSLMKRLLQTAAHGTTEHSIIYHWNEKKQIVEIYLAVASVSFSSWDAPYLNWTQFDFDEFFK